MDIYLQYKNYVPRLHTTHVQRQSDGVKGRSQCCGRKAEGTGPETAGEEEEATEKGGGL